VTLLATLTATGMVPGLLIEGAADRRAIYAFVEQELLPSLRPGQTVVLDNLSVHKSARARECLAAAGWGLRYLPTYSPDINPIEQAFARLQAHLRRAGARTYDGLLATVAVGVDAITPQDARAFFADTGYRIGEQLKRRT
jgi:transposase